MCTFVSRFGAMLSALGVLAVTHLGLGVRHYAALNVALMLVWLALVAAVAREHKRRLPELS